MGQERRTYPRRPVHWEATVRGDGLDETSVTIRDFCAGGLFLQAPAGGGMLLAAEGVPDQVRICFDDPSNGQTCDCQGRVVRRTNTGLAISFEAPRLDVVTVLSAVAQGQARTSSAQAGPPSTSQLTDEVIALCVRESVSFVERVLPVFTGHTIDALVDASTTSADSKDAQAIRDSYLSLRQRENEVIAAYLSGLKRRINDLTDDSSRTRSESATDNVATKTNSIDELELVDHDDFEDWLNRSEIVSNAEHRFSGGLERLSRRLSYVLGMPIDEQTNPLGPGKLSELLGEVLPHPWPPTHAARTIYQLFGRHVLDHLGELYETLNGALRERDILPGLEDERPEIRSLGGSQRWHSAHRVRDALGASDSLGATANTLYRDHYSAADANRDVIRHNHASTASDQARPLESTETQRGRPDPGDALNRHGQAIEGSTSRWLGIQRALRDAKESAVQRPTSARAGTSYTVSSAPASPSLKPGNGAVAQPESSEEMTWRSALAERLKLAIGGEVWTIDERAQEHIESIAEWFQDIEANPLSPELLKAWSQPLAQLAVDHRGEFLAGEHYPIHDLLDQWDRAGIALEAVPKEHRGTLRERIYGILQKVCDEHANRPQVIADAASEISGLVDAPLEARAANLQRITEKYEGSKRLEEARHAVSRLLDERLAGRQIPCPLQAFVRDYWHHILVLIQLRSGTDSEHWQRAVAVVDRLLTVIGTGDEAGRPLSDNQKVFAFIDKQLEAFGRKTAESNELLATLRRHADAICANRATSEELAFARMPAMTPASTPVSDRDPYWHGVTRLLRSGQWLRVDADEFDSPALYRIQWVSSDHSRFILAHHAGDRIVEYGVDELASAFASGTVDLTEDMDAPLSERQWDRKIRTTHQAILDLATHDTETGLLNRKALIRELRRMEEGERRWGTDHALLCFDLALAAEAGATSDGDFGPSAEQVADQLSKRLGEADLVARIDTARFVVVLKKRTLAKAEIVAEEQRRALNGWISGRNESVSVGIVGFQFGGVWTPSQLLVEVEQAAAEATRNGGMNIATVRSENKTLSASRDNMATAAQLDAALNQGDLQLRAQRIQPHAMRGGLAQPLYEILIAVGSGDDDEQLLTPAQFLPAAERFGRMASIDRWVIQQVLEWCRDHPSLSDAAHAFTINLSGASLHDDQLPDYLSEQFARTGVSPETICFELSEVVVTQNLSRAALLIPRIHRLGCHFALDDVGTGTMSNRYLENLPIAYIKIDGDFVRDIAEDETDAAMVRSINELAHHLEQLTIAEYVEDDRIRERLTAFGVDYCQGYAIGYPQSLAQLSHR